MNLPQNWLHSFILLQFFFRYIIKNLVKFNSVKFNSVKWGFKFIKFRVLKFINLYEDTKDFFKFIILHVSKIYKNTNWYNIILNI